MISSTNAVSEEAFELWDFVDDLWSDGLLSRADYDNLTNAIIVNPTKVRERIGYGK